VGTRKTTWYFYDGAFVYQADTASRPRCNNNSCFPRCAHEEAVIREFGLGAEIAMVSAVGEGEDSATTYHDAQEEDVVDDEADEGAARYHDAEEDGGDDMVPGATAVLGTPEPDDAASPLPSSEQYTYPCRLEHHEAMDRLELRVHGLELHTKLGLILRPPLPASQTCMCGLRYTDEGLQVVRSGCHVYMECPCYSRYDVRIVEPQCPNACDGCALPFQPDSVGLFLHTPQTFFDAR
jgi:hypothetical protein